MIKAASIKRVSREIERGIKKHETALAKGIVRGLNKSATSVRKIASTEVRAKLRVRASYVKRLLSTRRANRSKLRISVRSQYERIPAIAFQGVRQTKKGVTVKMRKDKPRKLWSGAFIATMKSGHTGVFRRAINATKWTEGRPHTSSPNLKISEYFGPSVLGVFEEVLPEVQRKSDPVIDKTLNREIAYALSKR